MPGCSSKTRSTLDDLHVLGRQRQIEQPRVARAANHQLRRFLFRLGQQPDDLIRIKAVEPVIIHRKDLVARRHSGLLGGRVGQSLEHHHAPRQNRNHRAESLLGGGLHLLELLELAGIEEDGVRVQMAQQSGNRALVKGLDRDRTDRPYSVRESYRRR